MVKILIQRQSNKKMEQPERIMKNKNKLDEISRGLIRSTKWIAPTFRSQSSHMGAKTTLKIQ